MPDFSIRPKAVSVYNNVKSENKSRLQTAYDNLLGNKTFIGDDNIFDIFNEIEELETTTEYGYSQQKAIGQKAVLVYTGEGLKQYTLNIKLHHSFCRPDYIIEELEKKAQNAESFSYFQGEKYIGEYVIASVSKKITDAYNNVTLSADIAVIILENHIKDDEEFRQQDRNLPDKPENLQSVSDSKLNTPVNAVNNVSQDVFKKLTEQVMDAALRNAESYINSSIGGITDGVI